MKCTATLSGKVQRSIFILISCIAITLFNLNSYGQARIYATTVTKGNQANSHVDNANNAVAASETSFARVNSDAGGLAGLGSFQGELELKFAQPVDAGVTTFLRINTANPDLLNTLLGGSLGKLLANVLGSVVLGNRFFEAGARMNATDIIKRDGNSGFNTDQVKLIKDAQGYFYLAITPDKQYDRVYLKDYTVALLGLGVSSGYTDVYYAFTGTSADQCAQAFATSYDGTGISLDLLKLGGTDGAGVRNAQNLIDSDPNNFSTLSLGLISVAGSISQDVYFSTSSRADDDFSIRLRVDPALVNVGLLNNISVIGYKDGLPVGTTSLSSLLGLDLLGLFNSGAIVSVPISPGVAIDRVKVQVSSLLNVSIPQGIQLYGVTRSAGKPTVAQAALTICGGTTATLTATTANVNELRWYETATGGTAVTKAYNETFTTPLLTASKTYYVSARRVGCTDESVRVPVVVTVNPALTFATTTLNDGALTFAYSKQIALATGGTGVITYALASGSTLPAGLSLSNSGLITGIPTATGTFTFSIIATDTKGCNATVAYTLKVNGALTLTTASLPNGTVNVLYPTQTIPAATGGTGPYTYAATNLPTGLGFDPATRQITGTPTTAGTYTIPVTVTDANGNTVTTNYTIIVRDPLLLPTASLVNGVVGTPYPTQTIPAATGGNGPYIYTATGLPAGLSFDPDTRQITGSPTTAGTSTVSVTATDGDGKTITTTYTIKVTDPLVLATATLPDGTVGAVYPTQTIPAVTGGTSPYTYVATNVPAGLTFNPATRQITGTPTQSGSNNIVVTATDADGKTVSQTYVLKVNGELVLPAANLTAATVGTPYTSAALPAVSGGVSPYTYNATGLPAGLTFNSTTRVISGTPTAGGPFTITVTAKDSNGLTTSTDYALNVNVPAPVVAGTTTCAGTTATLTVSSSVTGVTYKWYASTGNTSVADGTSFTTPALSSTTTYYVEAVSGAGVSATRTAVTVTVNPAPALANIQTPSESITAGQSVTLRAAADPGVTVKWFAAATGGAALATGTSFNTPTLSTTTTYYVGTESALGCASTSRVPVTVTVTSGPTNVACNVASTQKSGVDGICVLCGVTNPGNAIDGNANTFTRLNVALGVGASVYQQLGFATPGAATDFIRLDLATPVGIADLSVLGGITVNVYNGTTLVKSYPLNSNLLNLQLLNGNRFTATVPATGAFDRVEVRYGAVVSALTNLDIYSATIIYPTPTIATTGLSICAGSTTTLTATPNGGTTLKWYASANSATVLATGNTFTTPALTATTTYYIEVSKGTCSNPERVPVTVTVNPVINFATTTLPNASLTFAYGKQINVATGGTPTFKYTLASGSTLPAGLTLSEAGLISGTPTASGDFTFSIVATDSKGCTATAAYTLKVTAAVSLPVATLPNGTANTLYPTQILPAAIGGTGPYTYTATNIPDGLSFDSGTRQLNGTPTTAGTYTIPVTVTDANGNKASRDYTLIVRDPLVLPAATLADGTTNTPYPTQTIPAATGGATPFTYAATGLPAGLTFDPATRQITGTPTTAGTSTVTVTATDGDGKTVTNTYTIKVLDPLVLATATLPDGTAGTVYPGQTIPAATGGTGPYTYAAANVPNGLSFDPATRQITGTPTQSGSSNITVTVTDAAGKTAQQTYVLKVNGVLVLPAATLANGTVGTPYTSAALPAVTGGTSPYTYSAAGLPTGLNFDPVTRVISGTPTAGGTYTVTVTAKDNAGLTTSTDYALNINVAAPVVAGTTTCAGTTATLAVTSPITGVTYKWYAAAGGASVAEGATFTTPALTANTTYYVEAVSGTVVSTPRTAVTVTVNPAPVLATVQTPAESISAGQSVTLRATADAGVTIRWFAAATGGTALATGASFNTPTLTTTTTYYVGTESSTGCASTSRVPVTVTVTSAPANAACNIASTQKSGVDGICVLCGVSNPGNAIDGNPNTFTRLTVAVGVGASVYQQLGFASQGSAADNIRLELASPVGLADLSVLGGITVSVYNGTTLVKSYPLNSNLLNLQLLSGNKFTATVPATGVYDRVEIRYGAVLSALTSLDIYSATAIYAAPTVATTGLSICAGSTTTLTATPNGGTNLKWYASANSATVLATGNTFTTPVLNATTTYYIEVSKGTCANTERVPVTVTVNPVINFAATTLSNASVSAAYSKQINVATGGTPAFKYTLASGSSLPAGLTLSETGVIGGTPTVSGDFTFSIVATDSKGCNATASFTLKVTDGLALAAATLPNGTVGSTYVVQTLPAATGGTTPFTYAVNAASLPPGLTFDPATRRISGSPTTKGTYTIPMTATDANGNKVSRDYTIIVRDPLVLPTAVLADGTAGTPYQTQTIPAATGGNTPYTYTATGVPQGLTFNPATREITGTPATKGTYTIAVTAQDGDGKTVLTNYTLKVNDPLVLPAKLLANGTVGTLYTPETIPAATGGVGPYSYAAVNVPAGLTFDPATRVISGTPTQSGSNNITVTVTDAAGKTAQQTYVLKVNGELVLPPATLANGTVGTPYTSAALPAVTGGTSPYTYTATGLPPGLTFDPITRVISGTPTTGGPYTVTVTAKDNAGLTTSTDYTLNVGVGAPVVAGTTTCAGTTATLAVTSPIAGVTYKWYASTGNTSIAEGTTFTTPVLNANTTYYVEAVSGTAVSTPRTAVTVTVNPSPALPAVLTKNESISAGQSVTLQASADAGVTVKWFAAATGGTALATGTSFNTPTLSATTTYYVGTESSTGCASSSRVAVTVTVTSGPANPNCNVASTQKSGVDGICVLCGVSNPGNAIDGNPNTFTRLTVAVGVGASVYQQLGFANPGTAADNIRLELASPVGLADLSVLGGITVSVYNGTTLVKSYPLNSSLLNLQLLSGNKFTATVPATGAFDRVEVRYGAVVSALTSLDIYSATVIYPTPTIAATGQTICAGSTTTLTATPNGGTTLKWYASETSATVLATGNTFTTPALIANTTYYIEVSRGTCANPERVPVTVTVTPVPTAPVVAAVAPVCSGSTAVLSVTAPATGVVYSWYSAATGGTALATGTTFTTPALTANTTYYVGAATGTCASTTRTAVNVTVNALPALATVTTNDANISAGQTATLAATAPAGTTIKWYAAPTNGTALATGPTFTTPTLTATTTYYVETSNASGCVSPTRVAVTVTVSGGPANPNCNAANSQQSGIEGICLLCSVQNPGNSVDNNFTNFTTISLPVGVGGSGYQRLIFPSSGVATDSVRLDLELPTGLADVSVLGGIKVTILNGTSVVKTYNLNSSLLYLQLLSGNRFKATLPATGVYDRVEVRAEGLVSALINLRIYGAEVIYPNPAVSADGQTICAGSSTKLSAAAKGGTTLRWYSAATGGTLLQTGENFTTPVLTATTTYYIEVSKGSCANVARVPVTVTVTTAPPAPVVAAVTPVCSGSAAVLSVTAPVAGTTYKWYTVATGGTAVFTGSVFTTPVLTASTIYYVEAANGTCVSATRTTVNATVNPAVTAPSVQASATTVNAGQTAILTASSTDAGVTFNWYTSAASTTPVFSGATYVTPPLTANTTYYVEAKSDATGCVSPSRTQVTITVNGGGSPNPVPCEAPTTQEKGVTGVALLADVFNPQLAVDNDTKTGSSLVMPVGLLGASVYQRVIFTSLSNVGDTARVLLSAPGKLLSLGILSNISVSTYNGATSNNDSKVINDPLIRLELLSGNTEALISFVPTQRFDKIEVRLNSGVAGLLTTVDLNYAQRVAVAPEVAAASVAACMETPAILSVKNPIAGIIYKWYNAAGVFQANGTTFTTPAINAATRFFVEANTASGCASYRTPVNVTVIPALDAPVLVQSTINSCQGNTVTIAVSNPITGVTYKWYTSTGIYIPLQDGPTFTTIVGAAPTSFSVEAVTNCGTSPKATATIQVGTLTPPTVTPASVTVSSGSPAVLTATSSTAGAIFKWYDSPVSNTVLFTGPRYVTDPLINNTALPATRTFYVTAEITGAGACAASARASVDVTILPNTNPVDAPCEVASVNVKTGVDGVALITGVFNPELAVDSKATTASSFVMPVGALGASVYQVVGFTGLSTPGDTVRLRISSPGKLLSLAVLPSIEVTTFNNGVSNNDMLLASNPIIHLELLSDNSGAFITFVPQKQFNQVELRLRSGLVAALTTLDFNYAQRIIATPTVQAVTATACAGTSANLFVQNPVAGLTYRWYRGATYLTGKDGVSLATDPTLAAGTYDFFVSATRNGCESAKTKVTVTILASPDAPVAAVGNPKVTCPNVPVTLTVNPVVGVTFKWYDALTGGTLLANNTNTYTTPANLSVGDHDFYVEAVNGNSCVSAAARTKITITVKPSATAADVTIAGANAPFCTGTKAVLTATSTTVTAPIFNWYSDASLTKLVFTGATFTTPELTANTTYYVTVSGTDKCENTAAGAKAVVLNLNPPATAADLSVAGATTPFCAGAKVVLTASSNTVTSPVFNWYSDKALTTLVFTGAEFTINSIAATTTYYVTVEGANKCKNLAADAEVVTVTVNPPALASDISVAGAATPFCKGAKATLTATTSTVTAPVFTWYSDADLKNAVYTGATFVTPELTETTKYYVTVRGSNKCDNTAATAHVVTVTVNPPATAADISVTGADAPFCSGSKATLVATTSTVTNPIFTWYSDADLKTAVFTGATFVTPVLTATKTYYVTVRGSNRCENTSASASTIVVTVNPPAVATDIAVAIDGAPFCVGTSARLTATSTTVTAPIFKWYSDAALTTLVFTGPVFDTPALTVSRTYYVTVSGSNRCENAVGAAKVVTLTVNPPATATDIIIAGTGAPFCFGTKAILKASSTTVTNPVFTWYTDAALTTAVFTGAEFETPALTANTTYYVTVRGANKCDNLAADARAVALTVNTPATAADLAVTGGAGPFCAGGKATLNATTTTVTAPIFTWYSDAALTKAVFTGATFITPDLTTTTTYYVTVSGSNRCESTSATAKVITLIVNPPAVAGDINVTGNETAFCAGAKATLKASSQTVTAPIFRWYSDAALTNLVFTGTDFETPVLTATRTYYVTVTGSNKCVNLAKDAKVVTVTVNPPATAADVTVTGNTNALCAGTKATLTATSTTVDNPIFTWYSDAALTTAVFTGPVFETPVLTSGTKTYYVTVRGSNKCDNTVANAKIVTITVNPPATAADIIVAGANTGYCIGTKATLTATSTTVTTPVFTWYSDAALTTAVFTGAEFVTPVLTATTTYYVTVRGANKCDNAAADAKVVTVTVNTPATAADLTVTGGGTSVCLGSKATLVATTTTVTSPVFTWYSDADLTKEVYRGANFVTPALTETTTYYVTVRGSNKCETLAADAKVVTITVNPPAVAGDITVTGNETAFCAGAKATLKATSTTVNNAIFTWYSDAALTNQVFIGADFETPVLTATRTYYVTVTGSNKCANLAANAKAVTVTVNPPATASDLTVTGADAAFCAGTKATLTATSTTVDNPIFTWYSNAALTTVAFTGPVFETPVLTANTTYYVTVRGTNKCENASGAEKVITVKVNPPAVATDIVVSGATNPFCAGATAVLTATSTTVDNPVFTWYSDAALTNAVFTGLVLNVPNLSATTTYYVTVRGTNKCANTAATARAVTITVNPTPDVPVVATTGTTICSGEVTRLTVQNAQANVSYRWYSAATGGTLLFTGPAYDTQALTSTTDFYVLAVNASGCENATGRVKVTVTVSPKPVVPTVLSTNVTVCTGSRAVLSVSNPQTGVTYNWYTTAVGGTSVGTGVNFNTPAITTLTTYYVEASNATCVNSSRIAVTVNPGVIPVAPASVAGAANPLCAGTIAVLSVNNPDASLTYRWYTVQTGGTSLAEGSSFTTPNLSTTTTYYVESVNTASGCASPQRTAVVVTILPRLSAPVVTTQSVTATSITFTWGAVAGAKAYEVSLDNGVNWVAPSSGATGTTHLVKDLKPDQSVTIRVRAIGQLDCQLSDVSTLTAKSDNPFGNQVFIPNTFTPNNDGKNDILYVYATTISKMKLRIYNQWGQFLYESQNIQNGWDGTYKGTLQPNGVYVYLLEAEFNDGTKTTKKGTVTLLR